MKKSSKSKITGKQAAHTRRGMKGRRGMEKVRGKEKEMKKERRDPARASSSRIRYIDAKLRREQKLPEEQRTYPNCVSLGRELGRDPRTIARDIEDLRCMGHPVKVCFRRRGYYYDHEATEFPLMQLSDGELFVLCMARQALASFRSMAMSARLESVFEKLMAALDGELSFDPAKLSKVILFRPSGFEVPIDVELFESVCRVLLDDEELEFTHTKLPGGDEEPEPMQRHVQPLQLFCSENAWYLYGRDLMRKKPRTFALSRMEKARGTGRTFEPPDHQKIKREIEKDLGAYANAKAVNVRLQFRGKQAHLVDERIIHSTQKTRWIETPKGKVLELTMQVAHTPELEGRVLRWRSDVRVLEPKSLKDAINRQAREIVEGW